MPFPPRKRTPKAGENDPEAIPEADGAKVMLSDEEGGQTNYEREPFEEEIIEGELDETAQDPEFQPPPPAQPPSQQLQRTRLTGSYREPLSTEDKMVPVRPVKTFSCTIGLNRYDFFQNKTVLVPTSVKEVLAHGRMIFP